MFKKIDYIIGKLNNNRKKFIYISNLLVIISIISIYLSYKEIFDIRLSSLLHLKVLNILIFGIFSYFFLFLSWNTYSKKEKIEENYFKNFIIFAFSNMAKYIPGSIGLFVYRSMSYKVTKSSLKKITKGVLFEQFIPIFIFLVIFSSFKLGVLASSNLIFSTIIFFTFSSIIIFFIKLNEYFYYLSLFFFHVIFQIMMLNLFFVYFCADVSLENSLTYLFSTYASSFLIGAPAGIGVREGLTLILLDTQSCSLVNVLIYLRIIYFSLDLLFFSTGFILKLIKVGQKS